MLKEFRRIPAPLQKQILVRLGLGALFLASLVAVLATPFDLFLWFPFAGLSVFFVATCFVLLRTALLGEFVVINGKCAEIGYTPVKRHAKYLILETEVGKVKVILHNSHLTVSIGADVKLFAANNTPVYEYDGLQALYTYIAIDVE